MNSSTSAEVCAPRDETTSNCSGRGIGCNLHGKKGRDNGRGKERRPGVQNRWRSISCVQYRCFAPRTKYRPQACLRLTSARLPAGIRATATRAAAGCPPARCIGAPLDFHAQEIGALSPIIILHYDLCDEDGCPLPSAAPWQRSAICVWVNEVRMKLPSTVLVAVVGLPLEKIT